MVNDPKFMKAFFNEMRKVEGPNSKMTSQEIDKAFDMYKAGGISDYFKGQEVAVRTTPAEKKALFESSIGGGWMGTAGLPGGKGVQPFVPKPTPWGKSAFAPEYQDPTKMGQSALDKDLYRKDKESIYGAPGSDVSKLSDSDITKLEKRKEKESIYGAPTNPDNFDGMGQNELDANLRKSNKANPSWSFISPKFAPDEPKREKTWGETFSSAYSSVKDYVTGKNVTPESHAFAADLAEQGETGLAPGAAKKDMTESKGVDYLSPAQQSQSDSNAALPGQGGDTTGWKDPAPQVASDQSVFQKGTDAVPATGSDAEKAASSGPTTASGAIQKAAAGGMNKPFQNPEQMAPGQGSDGYGQKHDPDFSSICSV